MGDQQNNRSATRPEYHPLAPDPDLQTNSSANDPGPPPLPITEITSQYKLDTLYIAIHEPLFDAEGEVIDLSLLWWNRVYGAIRFHTPRVGARMTETYISPEEVVELAGQAWSLGSVDQEFVLENPHRAVYQIPNEPTALAVNWSRFGEYIVEIAEDLSLLHSTRAELEIRRLELADAQHRQQLAELRDQLARNMHDSLIQQLFAIRMGLDAAMGEITGYPAEQLQRCQQHLQLTIEEIRQMVRNLDADTTSSAGDPQNLEIDAVLREMTLALGFTPQLRSNLRETLTLDLRHDLTAVIREALANVARHAEARSATVILDRSPDHLSVVVRDDGRGFDPGSPPASLGSHGLRNMTRRARRHHGELLLRNAYPGSEVIWRIPL